MKLKIILNFHKQSTSEKIERGRAYVSAMRVSPYFTAPNPLPNPSLDDVTVIINNVETAYGPSLNGGKIETQTLHLALDAYHKGITDLCHFVESRANANEAEGEAIIISAGMTPQKKPVRIKPEFYARRGMISGQVKLAAKAGRGFMYVWQMSPDPADNAGNYDWHQIGMSLKASFTVNGLTPGKRMWFRVARMMDNVQQEWKMPDSIIVL